MLRTVHSTRHAPNVSPFSEQRLLFAVTANTARDSDQSTAGEQGTSEKSTVERPSIVEEITNRRTKFRQKLFAVMGSEAASFVSEHKAFIEEKLDQTIDSKNSQDVEAIISLTREAVRKDILEELKDFTPSMKALATFDIDGASDEQCQEFVAGHRELADHYLHDYSKISPRSALLLLDGILKWEIDVIREREIVKNGLYWRLRGKEAHEREMRVMKGHDFDIEHAPSVFITDGNTIHIDLDAPDFQDPIYGGRNIERAIAHEVIHKSVEDMGDNWRKILIQKCSSKKEWSGLQAAVHNLFQEDPETVAQENKNPERILDEALAIALTNTNYPFDNQEDLPQSKQIAYKKQEVVRELFTKMISNDDVVKFMMKDLTKKYESNMSGGMTKEQIQASIEEHAMNEKIRKAITGREEEDTNPVTKERKTFRTNSPEEASAEELAEVLQSDNEKKKKQEEQMDAAETAGKVRELQGRVSGLSTTYVSTMKKSIDGAEDKAMLAAIIDKNGELVTEAGEDLKTVLRQLDILAKWDDLENPPTLEERNFVAANFANGNPYEALGVSPNKSDVIKANADCAADRSALLAALKQCIRDAERPIELLEKSMEVGKSEIEGKKVKEETSGFTQWVDNTLKSNSRGPVMWMTPLNIMKVFSIYKEAIVEHYNSNQTSKVYDFAKNLNIYKKIEHTLKKQARSANNEESSKFLDYLKDEGYTFDDIFGTGGDGTKDGVLFENRGNFNKAKAVINYAAEHAWLYKLDRFNGNNVYGIEFENIEGKQSFEELIDSHEAAKGKEIDKGKKKVDKDPDVEPIMNMIVEEIKAKNIFAVQGMMERLQGKGKWSHGNTWMLTTLLLRMREDPDLRVCFDKGMLDNIGNTGIGQSAWSLTWLKLMRGPLTIWKESGLKEDFTKGNIATQTIVAIEERLKTEGVEFSATDQGFKDRCEAIAVIMSGKTYARGKESGGKIEITGKLAPRNPISIFDDEFSEYRENFRRYTATTTTDPVKTDDDFFGSSEGSGSDAMLLHKKQTAGILGRESTGPWLPALKTKAPAFLTGVVQRYDELGKIGLVEAQKNFMTEMKEKFDFWFAIAMSNDSSKLAFAGDELDTVENGDKIIYEALHKRGLLDNKYYNIMEEVKKKKEKTARDADPATIKAKAEAETAQKAKTEAETNAKTSKAQKEEAAEAAAKKKIAQMGNPQAA